MDNAVEKGYLLKDILNQEGTRQYATVTHADIRGLVTDLTYMRLGACLFLRTGIINKEAYCGFSIS